MRVMSFEAVLHSSLLLVSERQVLDIESNWRDQSTFNMIDDVMKVVIFTIGK